ncbi:MAG: hypothetical protein U0869_23610 [Chloroflexota bacterium]
MPPPPPSDRATPRPTAPPPTGGDEWSLGDALGGAGLTQWIAIGLVVVGGYLLLAQLFPGISFPGSILMTVAGIVLLWLFFTHRHGGWALYAGAILASVGAVRVLAGILPFTVHGDTALGVGIGLLLIGYLRFSQAGGWGWQGIVGAGAIVLGLVQLALGLLPGSPGLLDLVLPVLILGAGVWLLARTVRRAG